MKIITLAALAFLSLSTSASAVTMGKAEMGNWYTCKELGQLQFLAAMAKDRGGPASFAVWRRFVAAGFCVQEPVLKSVKMVRIIEQVITPAKEVITIVEAEFEGKPYFFITSSVASQPAA